MQTHIIGVAKSTKLSAALKLMERSGVSLLPVMYGGKLIGALTKKEIEKTILKETDLEKTSVEKIMRDEFYFVSSDMDLDYAAKIMIKRNLARIPVVNNQEDMLCVGMISSTEILHFKSKTR